MNRLDFDVEYFGCYFTDEYIPIVSSYKSKKTTQCIKFDYQFLHKNKQKSNLVSSIIEHLSMSYTDYFFTLYTTNINSDSIQIPDSLYIEKKSKFSS